VINEPEQNTRPVPKNAGKKIRPTSPPEGGFRLGRVGLVSFLFLAAYLALDVLAAAIRTTPNPSPWYPPAALSLTLLLAGGPAYAPLVALGVVLGGAFVWHLGLHPLPLLVLSVLVAGGYSLPAQLFRRAFPSGKPLNSLRGVLWFLLLGCLAPLTGSLGALITLSSAGGVARENYLQTFMSRWIGDVTGILTLAPFLLVLGLPWASRLAALKENGLPRRSPAWRTILEASLQSLSILAALFASYVANLTGGDYLAYLSFLPVIWIALRRGLRGAVIAILLINTGSVLLFISSPGGTGQPALHLVFILVLSITGLIIGAITSAQRRSEATLREGEERFRTLVESMQDIVFTLDRNQRHTGVFGPWLDRFGFKPETFLGKNAQEVMGEAAAAAHVEANRRGLRGENVVYEWSSPGPNGDTHIQTSLSPIFGPQKDVTGLVGVGRDITQLKHFQGELLERQRTISLLNEITHAALQQSSLKETQQILADRLAEIFGADGAYLTNWDEAHHRTIPAAAYGLLRKSFPNDVNDPGELTLTESALKAGKALAVDDTLHSPYVSPKISAKYPSVSALALPLIASEQKLGAVLIGFNLPHHFTPDEIRRGEVVARHVALAVAKASLFEAEAQRSAQLSRANVLITALGRVAARIAAANDPNAILKTLGEDLKQLGIYFLFAPLTPDRLHIELRFFSLSEHSLARIERFTGFNLLEIRIPLREIPEVAEILRCNLPGRLQNPKVVIQQAFPQVPRPLLAKGAHLLGVEEDTPTICLPLVAQDSPTGVLIVWGLEMQEEDQSSLTIFASQVAIALEKAQLHANLQQLAITDPLTGVYNRRGLADLGQREVERARRYNRPLTAILLDIDHFKLVNDRCGHPAGDRVLQALAGRIRENIREIDILARYGGEEFVVLLPEIDLENAVPVAERLRQAIANEGFPVGPEEVRVTISLGLCQMDQAPADLEALIGCADAAMYMAKHMGRNCIATPPIPMYEGEVSGYA